MCVCVCVCVCVLQREAANTIAAAKRYKNVMGTDGDLRKLKLSKAKALLRDFGVQEEEVSVVGIEQL